MLTKKGAKIVSLIKLRSRLFSEELKLSKKCKFDSVNSIIHFCAKMSGEVSGINKNP